MGRPEKNDRERSRPSKKGRRKRGPEDDDVRASACRSITGASFPAYLRPVEAQTNAGHPEPRRRRGTSQYALSKQAKKCAQSRLCEILHLVQDDNAQFAALRKAVVILGSLLIVRRSALPRRDDLRTWSHATGLHQRVRSRRSIMEQTAR